MTDTERHDEAMRWLARNVTWSRRMERYRDPVPRAAVLVTFTGLDQIGHRHDRRHDRVA